jgi:cation diffusion facilitator CzcD-associated flavoprotein CzcO
MKSFEVVIIGSGFGGQCAAIRLLERGITDFRILERRDFMGGTWCQNTYPGAAVDVQSPLYSISSEPYCWSQMFAEQDELRRYTERVIDKHGLREKTELRANVREVRWDETRQRWIIETEGRGTYEARFVINASGPLSTPVIPDFPGRDTFQGKTFHTNSWDHGFDHRGKRVAIIGSGASAAQVIPAIAGEVSELHVFQRTPHWVLPRPDRRFSALERRLLGIKPLYLLLRWLIYWMLETRVIGFKYSKRLLNVFAQRAALRHLSKQVQDPVLRAKLTPDFTIGCKRIILSSTLYPALTRPNVTLHDKTDGIASIDARGILTRGGRHLDLDLIVWSTGYDATDGVISYPVIGRNGRTLSKVWEEYPRAYLGTAIPGFPNFFVLTGPNTGIGHTSAIFVIESQMKYVTDSMRRLQASGRDSIEVRQDAEDRYTRMIHSEMDKTVWKAGGCRSWYQSKSGHVIAMFPGFSFTYRRLASRFQPQHHVFS